MALPCPNESTCSLRALSNGVRLALGNKGIVLRSCDGISERVSVCTASRLHLLSCEISCSKNAICELLALPYLSRCKRTFGQAHSRIFLKKSKSEHLSRVSGERTGLVGSSSSTRSCLLWQVTEHTSQQTCPSYLQSRHLHQATEKYETRELENARAISGTASGPRGAPFWASSCSKFL